MFFKKKIKKRTCSATRSRGQGHVLFFLYKKQQAYSLPAVLGSWAEVSCLYFPIEAAREKNQKIKKEEEDDRN
jgi:hypothetical protein